MLIPTPLSERSASAPHTPVPQGWAPPGQAGPTRPHSAESRGRAGAGQDRARPGQGRADPAEPIPGLPAAYAAPPRLPPPASRPRAPVPAAAAAGGAGHRPGPRHGQGQGRKRKRGRGGRGAGCSALPGGDREPGRAQPPVTGPAPRPGRLSIAGSCSPGLACGGNPAQRGTASASVRAALVGKSAVGPGSGARSPRGSGCPAGLQPAGRMLC